MGGESGVARLLQLRNRLLKKALGGRRLVVVPVGVGRLALHLHDTAGMAMANIDNQDRAKKFMAECVKHKTGLSEHELMYINPESGANLSKVAALIHQGR